MWWSADVSRPINKVSYLVLFTLNFLGVALLYYPALKAGIVSDFSGLAEQFQTYGWLDIFSSWGFHSYIPFAYLGYKIIYTIAGFDPAVWSVIFWIGHALVGLGVFHLCKKWLKAGQLEAPRLIPLGAMLLFLVHPYQVETIVWNVCFHYMLCAAMMIATLFVYLNYIQTPKKSDLILASILFFLALCSKEYAYMIPVMVVIMVLSVKTKGSVLLPKIIGSSVAVLAFYVLCTYVFVNRVIGHRDGDSFDITRLLDYVDTAFHYFVKHLFFLRHWPHEWKGMYQTAIADWQPIALLFFTILGGLWMWFSFIKKNKSIRVIGAMFWTAVLGILPACFLFFYTLGEGENDRYGYIMMIFLTMVVSYGVVRLMNKWSPVAFLSIALFCAMYTYRSTQIWKNNAIVHDGLIESFRWFDQPEIFVLNMPNNYLGRRMYRGCAEQSSFKDDLKWIYNTPYTGVLHELGQYNMVALDQGFVVNQIDSGIIQGELSGWGSWWTYCNLGGNDYKTDDYEVDFTGKRILIKFSELPDDAIFIYHKGDTWYELDRSKL